MKWININDKLPEKNTRVLIIDDDFKVEICDYCSEEFCQDGFWFNENGGEYCDELDVTHWQPLPKAPK